LGVIKFHRPLSRVGCSGKGKNKSTGRSLQNLGKEKPRQVGEGSEREEKKGTGEKAEGPGVK